MKKKKNERREERNDVQNQGKYGYFSIVIHRARISNYNDGRERIWPGVSVSACAKNSQDEHRRRWCGFPYSLPSKIERRNDLSPSLARVRNYSFSETWTILLHPHRSPTVELALVVAKVAAGVSEKEEKKGSRMRKGRKSEDCRRAGLNLIQTASCEDKLGCLSAIYILAMYKG